jgi:microsomal dipeptidase-like Zn-dependent dipeptidase
MEKYIDIHIHPALKTYSKSFSKGKINSKNKNDKHSVWYYNPPTLLDKGLNYFGTITKFSQSNFTALAKGNFGVVVISLYPIERGFLVSQKLGTGLPADIIANFIMEIGKERVNYIQGRKDYFADVEGEYEYYRQLHGVKFKLNRDDQYQYRLVKSFGEIQENEASPENIISVVVTIEGGHAFDTGLGKDNAPESKVLANVKKAKNWEYRPFFVTFAHHFYNDLVGHCSSLAPVLTGLLDQKKGIGEGFTELGWKVLDLLLDNTDGKRIHIDIKHLSPLARKQYFKHLDTKYQGQNIPIIISHGAVNGLHSAEEPMVKIPSSHGMFNSGDINFYDVEFLEMAKRGGLIGLQMDERRLGDEALIKQMNGKVFRRKILFHRSQLFWNQVRHIAEVLDGAGYFGWGIQSLGTDFDGVVDPLNGYWTSEDLTYLDDYLLKHAYNYMQAGGKNLKEASNRNIDPEEIVSRVMTDNAYVFLKKYFV